MKPTLALLTALLLAPLLAPLAGLALPALAETPDTRPEPFHLRSKTGSSLGDAIPFYWQGQYHVFNLNEGTGIISHIVSSDLIHWKDLPPALLPCSDPAGPDGQFCWNGSVVEHAGTFYFFTPAKIPKTRRTTRR
jgi:sucrose-6-phosphate hydrolase SacC (GH32 family)